MIVYDFITCIIAFLYDFIEKLPRNDDIYEFIIFFYIYLNFHLLLLLLCDDGNN